MDSCEHLVFCTTVYMAQDVKGKSCFSELCGYLQCPMLTLVDVTTLHCYVLLYHSLVLKYNMCILGHYDGVWYASNLGGNISGVCKQL